MTDRHDEDLIRKPKKIYDDSALSILFEQYKMYVQTADNVSSRRVSTSRYLLTLSAALVAVYGLQSSVFNHDYWALSIPVTSVIVSLLWYKIIKSHGDLNSVKFELVHKLEQHLPAQLFTHEWRIIEEKGSKSYTKVTDIERWVPFLFIALHVILAGTLMWPMSI